MLSDPAIALVAHLNALAHGGESAEVAAHAVAERHLVHHVADPSNLLGLDPVGLIDLASAMAAAVAARPGSPWLLALPRPGRLGALRGPQELTSDALDAGAAVLAFDGGIAWVPHPVGPSLQWRLHEATRPAGVGSPAEADRALSEVVLRAGRRLAELGLTAGVRPSDARGVPLAPGYGQRQQRTVVRAVGLLDAVAAAREAEPEVLHVHALDVRSRLLGELEAAAVDALCAACSWPDAAIARARTQ